MPRKTKKTEKKNVPELLAAAGYSMVGASGALWAKADDSAISVLQRVAEDNWRCLSMAGGATTSLEGLPDQAIIDLFCGDDTKPPRELRRSEVVERLMDAVFADDDDEDADERPEEKPYEYSEDGVDTTHELYEIDFDDLRKAVERANVALKEDDRDAFLDKMMDIYWTMDSCEVDADDEDEDDEDTEDDDTEHKCRCCCGKKSK